MPIFNVPINPPKPTIRKPSETQTQLNQDGVTTTQIPASISNTPKDENQPSKMVFLNTPPGNTEDISKNKEKRAYAIKQINKYTDLLKDIESKTFQDHVSEIYIYEDNDANIQKNIHTNFYIRKYEEAMEMKPERALPFYYLPNIRKLAGVIDGYEKLSTIRESPSDDVIGRRNRFYNNWRFPIQTKDGVFFSTINSPHLREQFPRSIEIGFDLEPAIGNGLNSKVNATEEGITEEQYDNFCLKYIKHKIAETSGGEKYVVASRNYFNVQEANKYRVNSLFSGDDEEISFGNISLVKEYEQSQPEQEIIDSLQRNFSITISEDDKEDAKAALHSARSNLGQRTYKEILNAEQSAPSEPLLYEVVKYDSFGKKITSFYFPARHYHTPNGTSRLSFIDTQVKQGSSYVYSLISHQIIYGEEYSFIPKDIEDTPADIADISRAFEVKIIPNNVVVPVRVATFSAELVSPPGTSPTVKTVIDKTSGMPKFFLSSTYGTDILPQPKENYPTLLTEEQRENSQILEMFTNDVGLSLESNFQSKYFEIYRIEQPPMKKSDFLDTLVARVSPTYADDVSYSRGATYEDSIQKNKKYYYLFRSVNVQGIPSVPVGPFEYEIVDDGSGFFVNFRSYDMSESPPKNNISFRKTLRLAPHPRELSIPIDDEMQEMPSANHAPFPTMSIIQYLYFKMREESKFWNKKYKIRIVSKKTGRKIDLTFTPRLTNPKK